MQTQPIRDVPIFPLNTVLFPGGLLPLKLFETRYVDMMKVCLRDNLPFGVCLIREGREAGAPAVPEEIGCLANITDWDMPHLGVFTIQARGTEVFRILDRSVTPAGLVRATIASRGAEPEILVDTEYKACAEILHNIIDQVGEGHFHSPLNYRDLGWVVHRLAELMPIDMRLKQQLLECETVKERAKTVLGLLDSLR